MPATSRRTRTPSPTRTPTPCSTPARPRCPDRHLAGRTEIADKTKDKFEVGFLPVPVDRRLLDRAAVRPGQAACSWPRTSQKQAAAFSSSTGCISDEVTGKWSLRCSTSIPAQPMDTTGLDVSPLFAGGPRRPRRQSSGTASDFGYNIDVLTPQAFNDQMYTGFQEVLNGTLTPQAAGGRAPGGLPGRRWRRARRSPSPKAPSAARTAADQTTGWMTSVASRVPSPAAGRPGDGPSGRPSRCSSSRR